MAPSVMVGMRQWVLGGWVRVNIDGWRVDIPSSYPDRARERSGRLEAVTRGRETVGVAPDKPDPSADPRGAGPPLRRTYSPDEVAKVAGLGIDEVEWLIKTGRLRAVRLADGQARILQSAVVRLLEADDGAEATAERVASESPEWVEGLRREIRARLPAGQVLEEGTNTAAQSDRYPYAAAYGDGPSLFWSPGRTPGQALAGCVEQLRAEALAASLAELGWSLAGDTATPDGFIAVAPDDRCWAIGTDPVDPDDDPDDRLDALRNLAEEHPDIVDTVWLVPGDLVADPAALAAHLATVPPGGFGVSA
jgi:hypothetical protein